MGSKYISVFWKDDEIQNKVKIFVFHQYKCHLNLKIKNYCFAI